MSDILTIHTKLSERTRGYVDNNNLKLMKKGSVIVNTSRGPIIKENDLIKNLSDQITKLGSKLNAWKIKPAATEGYRTAEVTRGGVDTDEISSKTRQKQRDFLTYGLTIFRECLIYNFSDQSINRLTTEEKRFLENFAKFMPY